MFESVGGVRSFVFESKIVAFCQCWFKKRSGIEIIFDPIYTLPIFALVQGLFHRIVCQQLVFSYCCLQYYFELKPMLIVQAEYRMQHVKKSYVSVCLSISFDMISVPLVHVFSYFPVLFTFSANCFTLKRNHFASGYVWCRNQAWCRSSASLAAENELSVEDDSLYQLDSPT